MIGEIVVTIAALCFAALLLEWGNPTDVDRTVATTLATAVTIFWFQRRASEQANTAVTTIANGKLSALVGSLDQARSDSAGRDMVLSSKLDSLTAAVSHKQESIDKVVEAIQAVGDDPAR